VKPRGPVYADRVAGVENHTEVVCRVVAWALSQRQPPTARQIRDRWGMHKATACRYRRALLNAGLLPKEAR